MQLLYYSKQNWNLNQEFKCKYVINIRNNKLFTFNKSNMLMRIFEDSYIQYLNKLIYNKYRIVPIIIINTHINFTNFIRCNINSCIYCNR